MQTLILKENNSLIREKLLAAGIKCCECCEFKAPWLNYNHAITHLVHGVGYPSGDDDTTTEEQRLAYYVKEGKDFYYCKDVEEFISKIKEQQKPLTKEEFFAKIGIAMKQMPNNWRKGQKVFNAINEEFGVARIVQFQYEIDCFNDDSKINEFKNKAYEVYRKQN
jgi:hypothetical protein